MSGAMQELNLTSLPVSLTTNSPEETEAVGAALARAMAAGTVDGTLPSFIAMYGDLGSGKTAFTRGFASVASPSSAVRSPTFTIVNEYRGGDTPVFHFDMYRINGEDDLYSIGFYDYLSHGFCLCEWSENIISEIPSDAISVTIKKTQKADEEREIIIEGGDLLEDFIA